MTEVQATITLTLDERGIIAQLAAGHTTRQIAAAAYVSERTIKQRVHDLCLRTHTTNRTHLVAFALRKGLIA